MASTTISDPIPKSQKPDPARVKVLTLKVWAVLFPALWIAHALSPLPLDRPLPVWYEGVLSAVLALALSLLTALAILERARGRNLLRPTRANVIGSVCLTLLAPIAVMGGVPHIVIGVLSFFGLRIWFFWALLAIVFPVAYLISCLLIAGVRSRPWRFLLFCLVWWAAWSAHILVFNLAPFRL